jgi:glucose/arabinose dehydrogenase
MTPLFRIALAALLTCPVLMAAPRARAALPTDFADQLVVSGLSQPAGFAFLPDGRLLIIEQKTARVRLATVGSGSADTTFVVPEVNISGNERGLLGIAIDPEWPTRPYVYFYFDQTPSIKCWIVRYTASGDLSNPASSDLTLADRYVIVNDIPDDANNHNGGTIRFGPDGMLYASLGEDADPCDAQNLTLLKGVILRLDVSGLPSGAGGPPAKSSITPGDNPFVGNPNANAKLVYAYGLRNPFRFQIDPVTGLLYIADVGQNTWEEFDECSGGENFGWPEYEGPAQPGSACPPVDPHIGPIAWYSRIGFTASIISVGRYRRACGGAYSFPADYEGDAFFAEYYQGWGRRIEESGGSWSAAPAAPGQPNATDWFTATANVSDWATGPDGSLYYCKQFSSPSIRRIVYTGAQPPGVVGGLSATAVSASRIDLAWSAGSGTPTAIDIERRTPPAAFAPLVSLGGAATSHVDSMLSANTLYEYRVVARNATGSWIDCAPTASDMTDTSSGVGDGPGPKPALLTVFPNPFGAGGAGLTIDVAVAAGGRPVQVLDVTGRIVRTLEVSARDKGATRLTWDGRSDDGAVAAPGVYFVRISGLDSEPARRVVYVGR